MTTTLPDATADTPPREARCPPATGCIWTSALAS